MQTLNPYLTPILDELDLFLNTYPLSNEHQIITHLQHQNIPPFNHFSLANSKDLFSAHFLCMHALYHLKNHYKTANTYQLIIQSVSIQRITLTDVVATHANASTNLDPIDPLASYYLDPKHYFETQVGEINELLQSFWQKYIAQDDKKQALETLNLPTNADEKAVKAQYRQLAQQHHPDKGGCAEIFTKIAQAKSVLDKYFKI